MTKLEHLKALCERATKGKWECKEDRFIGFIGQSVFKVISGDTAIAPNNLELENAEFIAACNPQTVLKLLSIIEIQGKALEHIASNTHCDYPPNSAREALTAVDGMLGEDNEV